MHGISQGYMERGTSPRGRAAARSTFYLGVQLFRRHVSM